MRLLGAAEMQRADRQAIEEFGIPVLVLMENAAISFVAALEQVVDDFDALSVGIVAGRGHNGGDGFAIARHLLNRGALVDVLLLGRVQKLADGPARTNAEILEKLGVAIEEVPDEEAWRALEPALQGSDVVIDAIFGTGLSRPAEGLYGRVIEAVNGAGAAGALVVAVDVPSGLDADRSQLIGPTVLADFTVSFAAAKPCHALPPASDCCGQVVVTDISIPAQALEPPGPALRVADPELVSCLLPTRGPDAHKGHCGHILVVAGSRGKAGAAALVGSGALRAGAGLVTLATPASVRAEVAMGRAELMTEELAETDQGRLARPSLDRILELSAERDVVALGPGLGTADETAEVVRELTARCTRPLVLDADGLNVFAGDCRALASARAPLVLTPHPGEAARLTGLSTAEVQQDRLAVARRLAREANAIVLLKGRASIVAAPDGDAYVNLTGNAGMATAGMGDLLTGIVAALLAQGLAPLEAAVAAMHLHGLAGDLAVEDEGEHSLVAADLLASLPAAFAELLEDDEEA